MKPTIGEEDIENLVIQQIEFCNIVLLNKASEVSPEELGCVKQIVHTLQPKAEIIECDYGNIDLDKILNTDMFDFDKVATSAAWIQEIEGDPHDHEVEEEKHHHHHHEEEEHEHHHHDHDDEDEDHVCDEHCHHHHHHHHHEEGEAEEYGIGTFVYYRREPMYLGRFDDFVARKWPKNIIRAKGICYFEGENDMCYLFEQAGKQVSVKQAGQWFATMPEADLEIMKQRDANLRRDWDDQWGDRMQKIVFIGQNLDKEAIAKELDYCLVKGK